MSEQEEDERALQAEGDEATARHRSASKNRTGAVVLGGVAWVATMAAAVLATLFFAQRGGDVQSLSGSNDQLRDQVTYCASIPNPKADARCKEPVAPPAKEIIEGPRGLQGIPGLQGDRKSVV